MAKVSNIGSMNVANIIPSGLAKTSDLKSSFTNVMAANHSMNQQNFTETSHSQSVKNVKGKLEQGTSPAKQIHQPDTKHTQEMDSAKADKTTFLHGDGSFDKQEALDQLDSLKEEIAGILDISEEELEKFMAESGMTLADLLNPSVLQQLLLNVNGETDNTALLTNETLCNQLTELLHVVEDFKQANDIAELTQALESMTEQDFSKVLEGVNQVSDSESKVDVQEESKDNIVSQEKVPEITVEKKEVSNEEEKSFHDSHSEDESDYQNATLNQFVQNLSNAAGEVAQTEMESLAKLEQMQEIVNQVVEKIKVTLAPDTTSMEMQLNPESLGRVNVAVVAKNGEMTATFTVENQIAKEALESQMTTLKENLNEQGIKVDAIEVTVAEHGLSQDEFSNQSGQNFQNETKRRKQSTNLKRVNDSEEEAEEDTVQTISSNGTVDFTA